MRKRPVFEKILEHTDLVNAPLPDPTEKNINVGSRKHRKEIIPLYCSYDVETTTQNSAIGGWLAAVYSHAVAIANVHECHIYRCRRWEDFLPFLYRIRSYYNLSEEKRLIMWVANLSFEFSFLQHRLEWSEIFAKDMYQPLLAGSSGLDFREALTISGGSLKNLAETYCYTKKLVGDLDYKKPRNYDTALTQDEINYINNDVIILAEFSRWIFQSYIRPKHYIPMTKTGILLQNVKSRFERRSKELDAFHNHEHAYKSYIQELFPDQETYFEWFRYLFRGGYVHANAVYSDIDLYDEDMEDITSSYPASMLLGYVPIEKFKRVAWDEKYLKSHCCIIYATINNIRSTTQHSIESKNKIIEVGPGAKWDNGRLIRCKSFVRVALTELDYATYDQFYDWDSVEINDFYISKRGKLPRFLIDNMLESYKTKQALKEAGKNDCIEYVLAKSDVNTHYGALVKRIRLDTIIYDNGKWGRKKQDKDFLKEASKTLLLPQWGIWITATSRRWLLDTIYKMEQAMKKEKYTAHVHYGDTDSIKFRRSKKASKVIENFNKLQAKRLKNRGYRSELLKGIGCFSSELHKDENGNKIYVRFKTLGAKRYLYYDGKEVKATVAGMPKTAIKRIGISVDDIFNAFNKEGFCLGCEESGKLTPVHTDEPYSLYVNGQWMEEESGVALKETTFTLSLKDEYKGLIEQMTDAIRNGGTM